MKEDQSRPTAFMGKITAGVTHEMKNVLAIIRESAGLVEDIIGLSPADAVPNREKILRSLTRIADQVNRGVDLSTRLNGFAHSPDATSAEVDLSRVLDQIAYLSRRFTRVRGVSVEVEPSASPVMLVTDPLGIQMLIFGCIDALADVAGKGATVRISPGRSADGVAVIRFSVEGAALSNDGAFGHAQGLPAWADIEAQASLLGMRIERCDDPVCLSLRVAREGSA